MMKTMSKAMTQWHMMNRRKPMSKRMNTWWATRGENMVKYGEHNEKHLRNESMKNMVENGRFLARLHSHIVFHVFLLTRSLEKVFWVPNKFLDFVFCMAYSLFFKILIIRSHCDTPQHFFLVSWDVEISSGLLCPSFSDVACSNPLPWHLQVLKTDLGLKPRHWKTL